MSAHEDLARLRKALVLADLLDAHNVPVVAVENLSDAGWAQAAIEAQVEPPSPQTRLLVLQLLTRRAEARTQVQTRKDLREERIRNGQATREASKRWGVNHA